MTAKTIDEALENIYTSLKNDNDNIDTHIDTLKSVMQSSGQKEVTVDTTKLAQNNRAGRKMMESYFRKRGVAINFSEKK